MLKEVSLEKYDGVISSNRRIVKVFKFRGSSLDAIEQALSSGETINLKPDERLACIAGNKTVALVAISISV